MRRALAPVLLAVACTTSGSGAIDSTGPASDTKVPSAVAQPSADSSREIYIDHVSPTNPVGVAGRARTFENTVQVRVRDVRGAVVAEEFTTSLGEMGHHNPYSAELWIVRDPGPRVTVEAFEYSAKDGSERSLTSMVVPYDLARMQVTLMLPVGDDCATTQAFTRVVPKAVAVARLLVEALVAGAVSAEKAAGASSPPFPRGSAVNSVVLRGGTVTVDFNERVQNVGGSCAATSIRHAVTRTLQRLPTVREVVITAAGSERLALQP